MTEITDRGEQELAVVVVGASSNVIGFCGRAVETSDYDASYRPPQAETEQFSPSQPSDFTWVSTFARVFSFHRTFSFLWCSGEIATRGTAGQLAGENEVHASIRRVKAESQG